jgi:hypothetical protein
MRRLAVLTARVFLPPLARSDRRFSLRVYLVSFGALDIDVFHISTVTQRSKNRD